MDILTFFSNENRKIFILKRKRLITYLNVFKVNSLDFHLKK